MISFAHRYAKAARHEPDPAGRGCRLIVVPSIPLKSHQPDFDEMKANELTQAVDAFAKRQNVLWQFEVR